MLFIKGNRFLQTMVLPEGSVSVFFSAFVGSFSVTSAIQMDGCMTVYMSFIKRYFSIFTSLLDTSVLLLAPYILYLCCLLINQYWDGSLCRGQWEKQNPSFRLLLAQRQLKETCSSSVTNCTLNFTTFALLFLFRMTVIKADLKHRWLDAAPNFLQRPSSCESNVIFKQNKRTLCLGIIRSTEVLLKFNSWRCLRIALP